MIFIFQLVFFISCTPSSDEERELGTIVIEINKHGQFIINEEEVPEVLLEKYLLHEVEIAEKKGYQRSEITADLRFHPEVKMKKVSSLQKVLRNIKIKKVLYSNTLPDQMT